MVHASLKGARERGSGRAVPGEPLGKSRWKNRFGRGRFRKGDPRAGAGQGVGILPFRAVRPKPSASSFSDSAFSSRSRTCEKNIDLPLKKTTQAFPPEGRRGAESKNFRSRPVRLREALPNPVGPFRVFGRAGRAGRLFPVNPVPTQPCTRIV